MTGLEGTPVPRDPIESSPANTPPERSSQDVAKDPLGRKAQREENERRSTDADKRDLQKVEKEIDKQADARKTILSPEQQQFIRQEQHDLDPAHQAALVTLVQKLGPDMRARMQRNAALSADNVRLLGQVLPTLSDNEMDLFKAMPLFDFDGPMTQEDRRIVAAFPTMSKEEQLRVIMALPIKVEKQGTRLAEQQERVDRPHLSVGFITDAAESLMAASGYIQAAGGIDKIEKRLNVTGQPAMTNYTAIGSTLYVEVVGAGGTAQLFAVPMGGRTRTGADGATDPQRRETISEPRGATEMINAMGTYQTIKVSTLYKRSPDSFGWKADIVRTTGKLPDLLRKADARKLIIERTRDNLESEIVVKKDGKIIARTNGNINDRNQWEQGLEKMLEAALLQDETPQKKAI